MNQVWFIVHYAGTGDIRQDLCLQVAYHPVEMSDPEK